MVRLFLIVRCDWQITICIPSSQISLSNLFYCFNFNNFDAFLSLLIHIFIIILTLYYCRWLIEIYFLTSAAISCFKIIMLVFIVLHTLFLYIILFVRASWFPMAVPWRHCVSLCFPVMQLGSHSKKKGKPVLKKG